MQIINKSLLLSVALNASLLVPMVKAIGFQPHGRDLAPTGMTFIRTNGTNIECHITGMLELAGEGQITMRDCRRMIKGFATEGHYLVKASGWESSLNYPYWAEGSCMFGVTRIDDGTDTVYFSNGDFEHFIINSMSIQPDVKYMQPVQGTATCNTSGDTPAKMEWHVRQAPGNSSQTHL